MCSYVQIHEFHQAAICNNIEQDRTDTWLTIEVISNCTTGCGWTSDVDFGLAAAVGQV